MRAGLKVVAADLYADVDLMATCPVTQIEEYPEGFAKWLVEQKIDCWIYTGALENYPELVDKLAKSAPLLGSSGKVLREVRDPHWLAAQCHQERFLFPPLLSCEGYVESKDFLTDKRWLAKTYQHSSGLGNWALNAPADWQRAHDAKAVAQLRINGLSRSVTFAISHQKAHLYGMTEQLVGHDGSETAFHTRANPWQYAGSVAMEDPLPYQNLLQHIGNWLHRTGLRGIVGLDVIDDGKELWLIEINPRYTASVEVIERSMKNPLFDYLRGEIGELKSIDANEVRFSPISENKPAEKLWGKAILYAKENVKISAQFKDWAIDQAVAGYAADLPHEKILVEQGHPVLTLFSATYRGPESCQRLKNDLLAKLIEAEKQLYE